MTTQTETAAFREPWTVRVSMWSARRRWLVFGLWFVATIGLFGVSVAAGGIKPLDVNSDPSGPQLEAEEAYKVAPSERTVIVLNGGAGAAQDPAFRAGVANFVAGLAAARVKVNGTDLPTFDQLANPLVAPAEAGLI